MDRRSGIKDGGWKINQRTAFAELALQGTRWGGATPGRDSGSRRWVRFNEEQSDASNVAAPSGPADDSPRGLR
jgi:hypothetical protein